MLDPFACGSAYRMVSPSEGFIPSPNRSTTLPPLEREPRQAQAAPGWVQAVPQLAEVALPVPPVAAQTTSLRILSTSLRSVVSQASTRLTSSRPISCGNCHSDKTRDGLTAKLLCAPS